MKSSNPAPRSPLHERIEGAILEAAARTLAEGGSRASMSDVAASAGVARATLYRYFPSRQSLVDEVVGLAARDAASRLQSARLDELPVSEGVERAVRALVEVGDAFTVLAQERARLDPELFEVSLGAPLRRLVERGRGTGGLRDDVPVTWLIEMLVGLVVTLLPATPPLGREDTIATITSLFLEGAGQKTP